MGFAQLGSISVNDYEEVLKHHQDTHSTTKAVYLSSLIKTSSYKE